MPHPIRSEAQYHAFAGALTACLLKMWRRTLSRSGIHLDAPGLKFYKSAVNTA